MLRMALISLALLASLAPLISGGAAFAQTDPTITARRAARQLSAAGLALAEAENAADRVAALTQTIRAYEEGLVALRQGLRKVAIRELALRQAFEARSEEISQLLAALLTTGRSPAPLLLLHPSGPEGTARAAMILSDLTPALQEEAEDLRYALEELSLLQAIQQSAADSLQDGLLGVQRARAALSAARAERTNLPRRFVADPAAMQALLDNSETLRAFAQGLNDIPETRIATPAADFTAFRGLLPLPVIGRLLHGFNETDAAGITRPGLVLATRPDALVTTPVAATIRYAGPLLDYGNVIILEPHKDYLLVLAGLGSVYGLAGEVIAAGSPVGLMAAKPLNNGADPALVTGNGADGAGTERSETLYIEIRHGEEPTDPALWFEPSDG